MYVFNHNSSDVSKLDQMLKIEQDRTRMRELLSLEKIVLIGILDSMVRESYSRIENDGKVMIDTILGVYFSIMDYLNTQKLTQIQK